MSGKTQIAGPAVPEQVRRNIVRRAVAMAASLVLFRSAATNAATARGVQVGVGPVDPAWCCCGCRLETCCVDVDAEVWGWVRSTKGIGIGSRAVWACSTG